MKVKIEQVESDFASKLADSLKTTLHELRYSIPQNYRPCVSFLDAKGRKKRSSASADNWSPESGRIEIRFEAAPVALKPETEKKSRLDQVLLTAHNRSTGLSTSPHPAEKELLKALDRAESRPGWSFVSLKKFRDEILPAEPLVPNFPDVVWENVLRSAIEKRLILVTKVANPKSPQFPVTAIRLNRLVPEVRAVLGQDSLDLEFRPIHISGEPLSSTILRERR